MNWSLGVVVNKHIHWLNSHGSSFLTAVHFFQVPHFGSTLWPPSPTCRGGFAPSLSCPGRGAFWGPDRAPRAQIGSDSGRPKEAVEGHGPATSKQDTCVLYRPAAWLLTRASGNEIWSTSTSFLQYTRRRWNLGGAQDTVTEKRATTEHSLEKWLVELFPELLEYLTLTIFQYSQCECCQQCKDQHALWREQRKTANLVLQNLKSYLKMVPKNRWWIRILKKRFKLSLLCGRMYTRKNVWTFYCVCLWELPPTAYMPLL